MRLQEEEENKWFERADEENMPECKICFEKILITDVIPLECNHMFHWECLHNMLKSNIESMDFPIRCPDNECWIELSESDMRNFMDGALYEKYQEF